jgi:preprotein translocase subunit YajC
MDLLISNAYAEGAPAAQGGDPMGFIFLIGMVVIFYFLLIRPQQKRAKEHRKLVEALSKGDEVVTSGGILGTISDVGDQYLTVKLADGVEVRMQKQAVSTVLPKGSIKAAEKE